MAAQTVVTKKSFKDKCDFHVYRGYDGRKRRINAIFYDWQETPTGRGFKCGVAMSTENGTKAELFEAFYQWVCNSMELPWYIRYKYAISDGSRFKCPIGLNF
jgi:hypothetical protein